MWQAETTIQGKRELLTMAGACATSQHVATETINAIGSGYVVGEVITLTHAGVAAIGSTNLNATFEVLAVDGGGGVTSLVRRNWGAFSNRVTTVAIGAAAGTGYSVGDIVEIQGGTERQMAKARVDTEAAGVPATISLFENGGSYSVAPGASNNATLGIGPSGFGGNDGLQINITMTGLIGTTGLATTSNLAGTGLTLDITLAQTGWFTGSQNLMIDTNDFSINSVNDEKQLAMKGTVTGGDEPFIMMRTAEVTPAIETNHFIGWNASDAFNPALDFDAQSGTLTNISMASTGHYTPMFDAENHLVWVSISQRSVRVLVKAIGDTITSYVFGYAGLGNSFSTTVNNPYPLCVGASTGLDDVFPDDTTPGQVRGPIEAYETSGDPSPWRIRRQEDATTGLVRNADPFGTPQRALGVYPCMNNNVLAGSTDASTIVSDFGRRNFDDIIRPDGASATIVILPTPNTGGALFVPIPGVIMETPSTAEPVSAAQKLRLEIENIFWVPGLDAAGAAITAEDTLTDQNGDRYRVFRSGSRSEVYSLWAMKEE